MAKKKAEPKEQRPLTSLEKEQLMISVALSLESVAESMNSIAMANEKCMAMISVCVNNPAVFAMANTFDGEAKEHFLNMRAQIVSILNS